MRTYFFKIPWWFRWLQKDVLWSVDTGEKLLFLTFDDGPVREVTPFVLDLLDQYSAKATFFCLGENLEKNPDIAQQIEKRGHLIGNHTYSHCNGWKVRDDVYLRDVQRLDDLVPTSVFRPPYGRMTRSQKRLVQHRIVLWSHMAGDFDQRVNLKKALKSLLKAQGGSIMIFHDSKKAFNNLRYLLPSVLKHFSDLGYTFKTLQGYATD